MIEQHVVQASTYAADIDNLIMLVAVLGGFWFFAAQGMFFWLLYRFRERPGHKAQYVTGDEKELKQWVSIPHMLIILCDVAIIVGAVMVWMNVKQTLPEPDRTIRVVAQQWAWTFVQPGPDGELDTEDDITTTDELHVEVGQVYHYQLESTDVLHDFSVPVFRLKQDAVPGRRIVGWFEPIVTGEHDIQCAEMCGIGHGAMAARIFIETPEQHAQWMRSRGDAVAAAD
ncbi:MAG: cytochrome C oxidase subunit II [Sandaracinaceae bacterium]|nr:cytochrome C oxidase subunit II [Sandaracinaceae bacterium]